MGDYIYKILTDTEKLHQRSQEASPFDKEGLDAVKRVVADLKSTLKANTDVPALAAPQLGSTLRIFCIKFNDGKIVEFVNPMITKSEGLHLTREKCKSIPGAEYIVPRNDRIIAVYQTTEGKVTSNKFEGAVAEIFQQMVNLLDGILISDFGLEVIPAFDKASEEEKKEVLDWYINQLKESNQELQAEIESDEELKQVKGSIDFMSKVASGEITVENIEHKPETETGTANNEA